MYIQYFDRKLLLSLVSPRSRASLSFSIFWINPAVSGTGACSIAFRVTTVPNSLMSFNDTWSHWSGTASRLTGLWLTPTTAELWSREIVKRSLSCEWIRWHWKNSQFNKSVISKIKMKSNSQLWMMTGRLSWYHRIQRHQLSVCRICSSLRGQQWADVLSEWRLFDSRLALLCWCLTLKCCRGMWRLRGCLHLRHETAELKRVNRNRNFAKRKICWTKFSRLSCLFINYSERWTSPGDEGQYPVKCHNFHFADVSC